MLKKILAVSFLNFKQGIRDKLFLSVVFFFVFFLAFCALLGKLSVGESEKVLRNAGLAGIELSGLILVVFSLVFSFYREKESRILEIYLSCFSRTQYISGKFIGYLLICTFYLVLAALGYSLILFLYNGFIWQVTAGIFGLFLKLSIAIGFSLLFSCLFYSPTMAFLGSLFLYLATEAAYPTLKIILEGANSLQIILYKCLYYLLPNLDKLDLKSQAAYGELPNLTFFISAGVYGLGYCLFLWFIARLIFLRKEY